MTVHRHERERSEPHETVAGRVLVLLLLLFFVVAAFTLAGAL